MNKSQVLALLLREWRIHGLPGDRTMRFLRVPMLLFRQAPMLCQLPARATPPGDHDLRLPPCVLELEEGCSPMGLVVCFGLE
jgi:hypothetical protein